MPKKVIYPGDPEPFPTHKIDEEGKNHYGIAYRHRYRLDYSVKTIQAEHKRSTADQQGNEEYIHFKLGLYEEYDLGLIVPINMVGGFFSHMIHIGSQFTFKRGLLVPTH